jgi:hypothetical protein
VIFDDDGKGEIADVVALRITDSVVSATLFHCKYSGADTPGARLSDLYEVCGQAQKSARWRDRPNRMLQHMLKREQKRRVRIPTQAGPLFRDEAGRGFRTDAGHPFRDLTGH